MGNGEVEEVDGDVIGGSVQNRGHHEDGRIMHRWNALYLYQLELPELLSDCFCMSFQSGVVFCNSKAIRGWLCQDTENQMLEFKFRVYQSM